MSSAAATAAEDLLTEDDLEFLRHKEWRYSVYSVGGEVHVVLHDFPMPTAYTPALADLLVRLPVGYPNANPDMYWTKPDVRLKATGSFPEASAHHEVPGAGAGVEVYANTPWQRWSRHYQEGWRPGVDGLRTYMGAVIRDLNKQR